MPFIYRFLTGRGVVTGFAPPGHCGQVFHVTYGLTAVAWSLRSAIAWVRSASLRDRAMRTV